MTKLILGSKSPRRREIMDYFSLPFEQVASDFDEDSVAFLGNPHEYAKLLSQKKAEVLAQRFPADVILTADSCVFCKGKLYNKPIDEHEAKQYLLELGGQWQSVCTGVTVRQGSKIFSDVAETKILFNPLTEDHIKKFHLHSYALDKAGGYTIEKSSNLIVSRIEGCYYNVLGLPINTVQKLLLKVGIDLWDYLKLLE